MEAQTVILMASLQVTNNVLSGAFYVAVQYVENNTIWGVQRTRYQHLFYLYSRTQGY